MSTKGEAPAEGPAAAPSSPAPDSALGPGMGHINQKKTLLT